MYTYPELLECHDIHLEIINSNYVVIVMNSVTKKEDDPVVGNAKVDAYANAVGMDDRNREAMKVLVNGGTKEFIKHVFTGDDGGQLSYAEMRARYG
jgi:hypothetical protein